MSSLSSIQNGDPAQADNAVSTGGETTCTRLLVVDDEESVALTVGEVLRQEGFEVTTASSGSEAVARLDESAYDLVLTDLHMEGGDGISVLEEVKRRDSFIITIVLTGFASVESAIAALRHGAYDYLIKPCLIDDLKFTVRRGIEHRCLMLAEREARMGLEQLNRELEERVTERTAELQRLNNDLEQANRAKDMFLATLSHELRTPLTPVLGWVNLLRSGGLDERGIAQALDTIERNARLQARLIDDLLDISRIVSGKLRFEPEPVDLNSVIAAAVETVKANATARRVELNFKPSDAPLVVQGSPVRLQQIVWNLLSNAVKFTEGGGRVSARVENSNKEARVIIEDTGIGIAPEFLPHVFDRFRQADPSTTRQFGGLGLGLAIVDALVKLHKGHVTAESEGLGRGSRFTFAMPCVHGAAGADEVEAYGAAFTLEQPVLLVDDSLDTLELLCALFERHACRVLKAASVPEALQLLETERPGLIISDIGLPGVDGYEFIGRVRRLPDMEKVPAIAISGYAMEEDRQRALAAGFAAHLAKPLDPSKLFTVIRQLVKNSDE
jgi:signal transduction histidine kinase